MVAAFLDKRTMSVKVNGTLSAPKRVKGGSPQGTRLGNFLFVCTIDNIEDALEAEEDSESGSEGEEHDQSLGLRNLAGRICAIRRFDSGVDKTSTPYKCDTGDGVIRYEDMSGRFCYEPTPEKVPTPRPTGWKSVEPWADKYIDDLNIGQKHCITECCSVFSTAREKRLLNAEQCENTFKIVRKNATRLGMKINTSKTQLLCISGANFCETESFIETCEGERCLLYTSPSPRDRQKSRMPSSA